MTNYIDGFVHPIPRDRINDYQHIAEQVAAIWKEFGAIDYCEYVGDDMSHEGTGSFTESVSATENEAVIFGYVMFESREARDLANERVQSDPRMTELIKPLLESTPPVFDARRMAYGGFKPLVC